MKRDTMPTPEMPVGFALSLALHPSALQRYAEMDKKSQTTFLLRAESATTRTEMQALIRELERDQD